MPDAIDRPGPARQESAGDFDEDVRRVARRLVVELNSRSSTDLAWLVDVEEANKTTVVNRAVQVYAMVIEAQLKGKTIAIVDPESGEGETIRIV